MSRAKDLPIGADGFQWRPGTISNQPSFALWHPDGGQPDAYVYRNTDGTWAAVGWDGEEIANGQPTSGAAMAIADNRLRPCTYVDTHPSHGIVGCDNERAPRSDRCPAHQETEDTDGPV